MNNIQDAVITGSSPDTAMRELQTKYDGDSVQNNMIHAEPYGFTSEPFTDSKVDAVTLYYDDERNRGVVIAACDRRYRIVSMKQGEVALYDDKGRHVYLKRDGIEIDGVSDPITVTTTGNVTINSMADITMQTSGNINLKAGGEVNISASNINLN